MSTGMALAIALIVGLFLGGWDWHRREKARDRAARRVEIRARNARAEAAAWSYAKTEPPSLEHPMHEYARAALHRDIRHFERGEGGATSLASVLIPTGLFLLGLLIVGLYR